MGGVQLFPKAFQPIVKGGFTLIMAPYYVIYGIINVIVGIILLPVGD